MYQTYIVSEAWRCPGGVTHLIRSIRMIISVLLPPCAIAFFADFLARIVPRFR